MIEPRICIECVDYLTFVAAIAVIAGSALAAWGYGNRWK